jgi:hypothetical protein
MPKTLRYPRFEIRIDTDKGSVTHISSAQTQAEAIDRVMRVYEGKNPVLSNVKPLGVMRQKTK